MNRRLPILVLILLAWPVHAQEPPHGPEREQRVLLPDAATRLEAAFARAAPEWRLEDAKITQDRVAARVCAGPTCGALVLGDARTCTTAAAGPWCMTWTGQPPADPGTLYAALAEDADAVFWHVIAQRPPQPPIVAAPPRAKLQRTGVVEFFGDLAVEVAQVPTPVTPAVAPPPPEDDTQDLTRLLVLGGLVALALLVALGRLRKRDRGVEQRP